LSVPIQWQMVKTDIVLLPSYIIHCSLKWHGICNYFYRIKNMTGRLNESLHKKLCIKMIKIDKK